MAKNKRPDEQKPSAPAERPKPAPKPAAKPRAAKPKPAPSNSNTTFPTWAKAVLSIAVVWHLFVVFISPFSIPPSSETVVNMAQSKVVRWYSEPLYLNHGYSFFGPEPPTNQLVRYEVLSENGDTIAEGEFPNREQQWPRLMYHRHMMLADQAGLGLHNYPDPVRLSLRSYARHLLKTHAGADARLDLVRHRQLNPDESKQGMDDNDPDTFRQVMSVRELASDLETPLVELPEPAVDELPAPNDFNGLGDLP